MATFELSYTIPAGGGSQSVSVQATLTATPNNDAAGSYTIQAITGTRTVGSIVETINGLSTTDTADNLLFPNDNAFGAGGAPGYFDFNGLGYSISPTTQSAAGGATGFVDFYRNNNTSNADYYAEDNGNEAVILQPNPEQGASVSVTCYASGTLIRVARGQEVRDVTVEDLAVGDLAVTADGAHRPIRWLGSRTIDCRADPDPRKAQPVRIAKDAFGPARPSRDLFVSPDHSICVGCGEELLIPAVALLNGATVAYAGMDTVTYWHVELDSHDILLANNLPAESFLEMGANRRFFAANGDVEAPLDALARTHADFCRPFVDAGPVLDAVRARLAARAARLGWRASRAVALSATAGGSRVPARVSEGEGFVCLPRGAGDVCIATDTLVPAAFGEADPRRLGIAVYAITVEDGDGTIRTLDLDGAALRESFHAGERHEGLHYRWTSGELVVPAALLAGLAGPLLLHLAFEPSTVRGWTGPACESLALTQAPLTQGTKAA